MSALSLRQRPIQRIEPAPPRRRLLAAAITLVVLAALVGLSVLLYQSVIRDVSSNSDGATVVLEGAAMRHGNLALDHWSMSRDSFWSIDVIFYAVAVLIEGIRPNLLYLVPAVIAALVVLAGVACARAQQRVAAKVAALLTVVALLALPSKALQLFYVQGPYHVGTALYALIAFIGLSRRQFNWGWVVAIIVLGVGLLGDLQLAVFATAPVLGAGLVAMARQRSIRAGLSTTLAVPASALVAFVARQIADAFGTFSVNRANPTASPRQMLHNLVDILRYGPGLLGIVAGHLTPTGMPRALSDLHVLALVAIVVAVVLCGLSLLYGGIAGRDISLGTTTDSWHLEDLLVLAFVADVALFARLDSPGVYPFCRYLTAAIIFGAILAARLVGRLCDGYRHDLASRAGLALTAAVGACFAAGFALSMRYPIPPTPTRPLVTFLESKGLTHGIGDYWTSTIITVQSSNKVVVRPVIDGPAGTVVRYQRQSSSAWYANQHFQFLVYDPDLGLVDPPQIAKTFGTPTTTYAIGGYRVAVFGHTLSVGVRGAGGGP